MIDSKDLCRITGLAIVAAQLTCLMAALGVGVLPMEYAYGFSFWGIIPAVIFLKSK